MTTPARPSELTPPAPLTELSSAPVLPRRNTIANARLRIDDLAALWVVNEGTVDVFAVRVLEGEPIGPRRWLFTAGKGAALFALPRDVHDTLTLVAIASTDSEIETFDIAELRAAARLSDETRSWTAELLDSWIEAVSGAVARFEERQITDLVEAG